MTPEQTIADAMIAIVGPVSPQVAEAAAAKVTAALRAAGFDLDHTYRTCQNEDGRVLTVDGRHSDLPGWQVAEEWAHMDTISPGFVPVFVRKERSSE